MQTIEEAREHCRFVGKGIEKMVTDGVDLPEYFGGQSTNELNSVGAIL